MSEWPRWDRATKPGELACYVQTGVLARLIPAGTVLPGRSGAPAEIRVRQLYEAFAAAGVRYADEPFTSTPDGQDIRTPDEVLLRPGWGNCLDLCVVFAAGCLDAGLHPVVVVLDPAGGGPASHVVVVVWLRGDWAGPDGRRAGREPYPLAAPVLAEQPPWPGAGLRAAWDGTGEFVAVDVARAARDWTADLAGAAAGPASFEEAVAAAGTMLTGAGWVWDVGVDIGLSYRPEQAYDLASWPKIEPLEPPYHPPATLRGPLAQLRARNEVVPFEAREPLDVLLAWCLAPDAPDPLGGAGALPRVAVVHGTGGAGKTRLVAELAKQLAVERWYTGFLRSELLDPAAPEAAEPGTDLAWLSRVVSPVLLVIDYVEAADTGALKRLFAALASRRGRTVMVLTARATGDWWPRLTNALDRSGLRFTEYPPQELAARHPQHEVVYRRAYRRFAGGVGASSDQPPALPTANERWTTLDVVMLAWLAANTTVDLPATSTALYEEVLGRELANWNDAIETRFARQAPVEALRMAAAGVSLLTPPAGALTAALAAMGLRDQTSLAPGELAEVVRLFLRDPGDGTLAVRPDPIADHLITTVCGADKRFFLRCLDLAVPVRRSRWRRWWRRQDGPLTDPLRVVANLSRAADSDAAVAERLAALTLSRHENLWPQALDVVLSQGGPFVRPLERLAERDDTPLPLGHLAVAIPLGHGALRTLALIAATRSRPVPPGPGADERTLAERAEALNNLSVRQGDTGDRDGALAAIHEAVTLYRRLAQTNPAAFLPDLAMSLNNLSVQQSETGDRDGALTSIQEAVTIRRRLAQTNPAAFLPDLAMSLNNLSVQQSETGDRDGALTSIQEAVTIRRRLAQTNPAAFLPDLAMSLNNLSVQQSETGDRDGALTSIQEAVTIRRRLAQTNPAAFLPNLAGSLNNLSLRQSETGDRDGALTAIQEAVTAYRRLAQTNPAAFLPNLATSLNNLSNQQSDTGDRDGALAAWEAAWADLPPGAQAELMVAKYRWRAGREDAEGAIGDLLRAVQAADAETGDLRLAARARQQVRDAVTPLTSSLPPQVVEELPPWVTTPIPDRAVELVNTWLSAPAWLDQERILTEHVEQLTHPGNRVAIDALAALHADNGKLDFLRQVIADIGARGSEPVLAEIRATGAHATLIHDWIAAPTWSASQRFLTEHPELLADPFTAELLESMRGDPAAEQHLAIIRLAGNVPLPEIFDAVLDPTDARDLFLKITESGDADRIRNLWFAAPQLAQDPFAGPFAAALVTALTADGVDEETRATAQELIEEAAHNATDRDRRDALAQLRRLATNRPDRAATVNELARVLADPPPLAADARVDDVPRA